MMLQGWAVAAWWRKWVETMGVCAVAAWSHQHRRRAGHRFPYPPSSPVYLNPANALGFGLTGWQLTITHWCLRSCALQAHRLKMITFIFIWLMVVGFKWMRGRSTVVVLRPRRWWEAVDRWWEPMIGWVFSREEEEGSEKTKRLTGWAEG
jgi:hypothetical protein